MIKYTLETLFLGFSRLMGVCLVVAVLTDTRDWALVDLAFLYLTAVILLGIHKDE